MATHIRKPDRRDALERPYARDHESSVLDAMGKGVMPKAMPALVAWLMASAADECPPRLHRSGVWDGHEGHMVVRNGEAIRNPVTDGGGSRLGSPAIAAEFRRYLEQGPSVTDAEGYYLTPLRACISRLRKNRPTIAEHVHSLVLREGNWRELAKELRLPQDVADVYLAEDLRWCWREFAQREVRLS